jgi:hypothetical protein
LKIEGKLRLEKSSNYPFRRKIFSKIGYDIGYQMEIKNSINFDLDIWYDYSSRYGKKSFSIEVLQKTNFLSEFSFKVPKKVFSSRKKLSFEYETNLCWVGKGTITEKTELWLQDNSHFPRKFLECEMNFSVLTISPGTFFSISFQVTFHFATDILMNFLVPFTRFPLEPASRNV